MKKTTRVLVTRTCEMESVQTTEVEVCQEEGDDRKPVTVAEELIEAMLAAGHSVDWKSETYKPKTWPSPKVDGKIIKGDPPPASDH